MRLLPPPPRPINPQRDTEATDGHGEDVGQTRLKGTTEEDERVQVTSETKMSSHTKLRSSTYKEGGGTARYQQGEGSSNGQQDQRMDRE